jgi:hypothetical protein
MSADKPLSMKAAAHQFAFGLVLIVIGGVPLGIAGGVIAAVAVFSYRLTTYLIGF